MEHDRALYDPEGLYAKVEPTDVRMAVALIPPGQTIPGPSWRLPAAWRPRGPVVSGP